MSLPLQAVDRLFDRLATTYGREWTQKWGGVEATAVKTMWSYELSGYASHLKSIAWALEHLPERCPNLIEFRNLCRSAPAAELPKLAEPEASPERVAAELAKLDRIRAEGKSQPHGMKEWAHRLKARDDRGGKLNRYQKFCMDIALKANL